jgi:hypothetical protein
MASSKSPHAGMLRAVGTLAGSLGLGAVVFIGVSFLELKRWALLFLFLLMKDECWRASLLARVPLRCYYVSYFLSVTHSISSAFLSEPLPGPEP